MRQMKNMFRVVIFFVWSTIFSLQVIVFQSCTKDTANQIPEITYVTVNPETVYASGVAKVKVEATDPDNDKLTYAYQVDFGTIEGFGSTAFWYAPGPNITSTVIVTVTDGNGGEFSSQGYLNTQGIATQISGNIQIPDNIIGNLFETNVSIYKDYTNWLDNSPFQRIVIGDDGSKVAYNMVGVAPGTYYIDIWKDTDYNGKWSYGDYVGWKGSGGLSDPVLEMITVVDGQATICNINNVFVVSY